jgi:hypothetical protein
VLLSEQDIAEHGTGDLAPAIAVGREDEPPLIEGHTPAEFLEEVGEVWLGLPRRSAAFDLGLEGFAQLV